jgi:hypothetical protein
MALADLPKTKTEIKELKKSSPGFGVGETVPAW